MASSKQLCMKVTDLSATTSCSHVTNHFGYSPFKLMIIVEPQISNLEPQPINIQLVFEDGQQIDVNNNKKNNINFQTSPKTLFINKSGECKFTVQIDTYSMFHENKSFKLLFNVQDNASRHIIPCETTPFKLIKHKLEIIYQPDDIFYCAEGGRSNCLKCKILLKDCNGNTVKNRDIPLITTLVYEDMTTSKSLNNIFEILTKNIHLKNGKCMFDFRINEVSKNHNKRSFHVLVECSTSNVNDTSISFDDISSCVTNAITVKSKRIKKKQNKSNNNSNRKRKRKRQIKNEEYSNSSSDNDNTPVLKKQKNNINHPPHIQSILPSNINNNNTQYVPPTLGGLLPIIRPGALPRIGHAPPPFAQHLTDNDNSGVLGKMFKWCKSADWVMNKLEWIHCGYEYDEATHSIDTCRPLYKCSYCLRYKNNAGYGKHEEWCQLKLTLKEYEIKVKGLENEFNYQNNENNNDGQMPSLGNNNLPPNINSNNNSDNNNMNLPLNMNKISSVSRVRSQHGYDAYDKDHKLIGTFDDEGVFNMNENQFNEPYNPIFDPSNMIMRNQSDDHLFYNNIKNNIFALSE